MEKETRCNGFANYETWTVSLWMANDSATYRHYQELVRELCEAGGSSQSNFLSKREAAAVALAETLREDFEVASPTADTTSVYSDLMNSALSEVDWYELANDLLNDVTEDEPS